MALKGTFAGPTSFTQFTAQVSDSYGEIATLSPSFTVLAHVALTGGTCDYPNLIQSNPQPPIPAGATCQQNLGYSGGVPGTVTLKVDGWSGTCSTGAACPAPPISASGSNGTLTVTVGSLPANYPGSNPSGTYTIHIVDHSLCSSGTACASTPVKFILTWDG